MQFNSIMTNKVLMVDINRNKVIPGARQELTSPAWLVASAMNARNTVNVSIKTVYWI